MLTSTLPEMMNNYTLASTAQQGVIADAAKLAGEVKDLEAKLAEVRKSAETYDREFMDRKQAGEGVPTRLRRAGVSTLQDWALAGFFLSYAFTALTVIAYVGYLSRNKKIAIGLTTFVAIVLGVLISTLIMRIG